MAHGAHQHGHGHGQSQEHHTHGHTHGDTHGDTHGQGEALDFSAPRPGDPRRIEVVWPFVRDAVPEAPGSVLEIGCGALGGFVPKLREAGYHAVGVDPEAPEGEGFVRSRFEDYRPDAADLPFDAVVGSLALHHADDLDALLVQAAEQTRPGGRLVLREWAREEFDEATALWCFERLPADADETTPAWWLAGHRERWRESGGSWDKYIQGWGDGHGLLTGAQMLRALEDSPFETVRLERDPYFFPTLDGVTEDEEAAAIRAGAIRANGLRYVGRRR